MGSRERFPPKCSRSYSVSFFCVLITHIFFPKSHPGSYNYKRTIVKLDMQLQFVIHRKAEIDLARGASCPRMVARWIQEVWRKKSRKTKRIEICYREFYGCFDLNYTDLPGAFCNTTQGNLLEVIGWIWIFFCLQLMQFSSDLSIFCNRNRRSHWISVTWEGLRYNTLWSSTINN